MGPIHFGPIVLFFCGQLSPNAKSFSMFEKPIALNSFIFWCPEGDLNPHGGLSPADFKSFEPSIVNTIKSRIYSNL